MIDLLVDLEDDADVSSPWKGMLLWRMETN